MALINMVIPRTVVFSCIIGLLGATLSSEANANYIVCSIISHRNDEVILLKRFCDGDKNDLRSIIYLNNGVTIV